jgi:hypothetical protein
MLKIVCSGYIEGMEGNEGCVKGKQAVMRRRAIRFAASL